MPKVCYHCQSPIMQFGDLEFTEYNGGTFLHHRCISDYLLEIEMQSLNTELNHAYKTAEHYRDSINEGW